MERIILVVFSEIDPVLVDFLKQKLEMTFSRAVEVRYSVQNLFYAYDPKRKQYVSPRLISRLRRIKRNKADKVLGITNVDLYSPDYDFVFGEAEMSSGVATLSIYRLKGERRYAGVDIKLLEERTVREAIHELGHLFHLGHCRNPKCVMHACICVEDVDKAGRDYCDQCNSDLKDNLSEKIMSPLS